jgi:hypothetical protein
VGDEDVRPGGKTRGRLLKATAGGASARRHRLVDCCRIRRWPTVAAVTELHAFFTDQHAAWDRRASELIPIGIAFSIVSRPAWEPTPWRAVQRAAWARRARRDVRSSPGKGDPP